MNKRATLRRAAEVSRYEAQIIFDSNKMSNGKWSPETHVQDRERYAEMIELATALETMSKAKR
jgi:hypothetical protein